MTQNENEKYLGQELSNKAQGKGRLGGLGMCTRVRAIVQNHCSRLLSGFPLSACATNVSEYETNIFSLIDGCLEPAEVGREGLPGQHQIGGVL
jgi:hypothetical protein